MERCVSGDTPIQDGRPMDPTTTDKCSMWPDSSLLFPCGKSTAGNFLSQRELIIHHDYYKYVYARWGKAWVKISMAIVPGQPQLGKKKKQFN